MSAVYHGDTTFRCYHDCRQEGCPGHRIRVVSKHGFYFVEYLDADGNRTGEQKDIGEIGIVNAVASVLGVPK